MVIYRAIKYGNITLLLFTWSRVNVPFFAIFIITVAAAEVALGMAIVIAIYRSRQTAFVTDAKQIRH